MRVNNCLINRKISFNDLIDISSNSIINCIKINYFELWKYKIDFITTYYKNDYEIDNYDFNYYRSLSEISLNLLRYIDYKSITYSISYNRFYEIKTTYDLYDPFNTIYAPFINSFVELYKYQFFYNDNKPNFLELFNINLNKDDYYYFIARLIFPTYYYDLFKDKISKEKYNNIINNINNYLNSIKEIIIEIKKRHNDMPLLDSIINLL